MQYQIKEEKNGFIDIPETKTHPGQIERDDLQEIEKMLDDTSTLIIYKLEVAVRELSDRFDRLEQIFSDSFQLSSKQAKTTDKVKSSNTRGVDATVVNKNPATPTKSCDFELYMCSERPKRGRAGSWQMKILWRRDTRGS